MVMLLVKALHGLLLWSAVPCGFDAFVRSKIGLGELGCLWPGEKYGSLTMGVRSRTRISYGMLTAVVDIEGGNQFSGNQRAA